MTSLNIPSYNVKILRFSNVKEKRFILVETKVNLETWGVKV